MPEDAGDRAPQREQSSEQQPQQDNDVEESLDQQGACQTPNAAPVGSVKNAMRPRSVTSMGSTMTSPPASLTFSAISSASDTEM